MSEKVERRMVDEFLDINYPEWVRLKNQRLGAVVPPGRPGIEIPFEEKYAKGFRRHADAIVSNNTDVIIIEFKIRASIEALAQLEEYGRLFDETPELQTLRWKARRLMLVVAFSDPVVESRAKEKGIEYRVYQPEWVKEYWEKRAYRYRPASE